MKTVSRFCVSEFHADLVEVLADESDRRRVALPKTVDRAVQLECIVAHRKGAHVVEREQRTVAGPVVAPEGRGGLFDGNDVLASKCGKPFAKGDAEPASLAEVDRVLPAHGLGALVENQGCAGGSTGTSDDRLATRKVFASHPTRILLHLGFRKHGNSLEILAVSYGGGVDSFLPEDIPVVGNGFRGPFDDVPEAAVLILRNGFGIVPVGSLELQEGLPERRPETLTKAAPARGADEDFLERDR